MTSPYDAIPLEVRRTNWGWFGPPWWSVTCFDDDGRLVSDMRKPTPVGENCLLCDEPIEEGHSGKAVPTPDGIRHEHKECSLRNVVGSLDHLDGQCTCRDPGYPGSPGRSYREDALAVWERITRGKR